LDFVNFGGFRFLDPPFFIFYSKHVCFCVQ